MKRPNTNIAGIDEQLQAADDMAYIDLTGTPFENLPEPQPDNLKETFGYFYDMGYRHGAADGERKPTCSECHLFAKKEDSEFCGICEPENVELIG